MEFSAETSPLSFGVIGALLEVQRTLGGGFLEAVYQHAVACELRDRQIPFDREVRLPIFYKREQLEVVYRADFLCGGNRELLLELKAQSSIGGVEEAQVINYLKATGLSVAILANFGPKRLEFRRFVVSHDGQGASVVNIANI
jgi:GxxExxY protein